MDPAVWLAAESHVPSELRLMSLSSFCVVTNALRLSLFDMRNAAKDKQIKRETGGKNNGKDYENRRYDVRTL